MLRGLGSVGSSIDTAKRGVYRRKNSLLELECMSISRATPINFDTLPVGSVVIIIGEARA